MRAERLYGVPSTPQAELVARSSLQPPEDELGARARHGGLPLLLLLAANETFKDWLYRKFEAAPLVLETAVSQA